MFVYYLFRELSVRFSLINKLSSTATPYLFYAILSGYNINSKNEISVAIVLCVILCLVCCVIVQPLYIRRTNTIPLLRELSVSRQRQRHAADRSVCGSKQCTLRSKDVCPGSTQRERQHPAMPPTPPPTSPSAGVKIPSLT